MNLNDYIKQSYKRPNRQILTSLGANERLIEYLMETPGNTNWQVVEAIGEGESVSQYTFHFIQGEITIGGEVQSGLVILDTTEFEAMWDTIGNGRILDFEIKNVEMLDGTISDFTIEDGVKDVEIEDGMLSIQHGNVNKNFYVEMIGKNSPLIQEGYPSVVMTTLSENDDTLTPASCDLVVNVLDGYVIKVYENNPEIENEVSYYFIKNGESFTLGYDLTDGTNIYEHDVVIIPTSDMVLWVYNEGPEGS